VAGLFLLLPFALTLLGGLVVAGVVLVRRTPSAALPLPVSLARRRGNVFSTCALLSGVAVLGGLGALAVEQRSEVLVLITPLWAATAHAVVCLLGELTWPRTTTRVRGARLVARGIRESAPPLLWWTGVAVGLLVVALCVAGTAVAGLRADSYVWTTTVLSASAGTFPGGALALPVLAALLACALATGAVLHRLPARPAVPCASETTDRELRRTGGHRVLRISVSAAVGTCGVLTVLWGGFFAVYGGSTDALGDVVDGPLVGVTEPVTCAGLLLVLAGVTVLLVPARALRA